MSVGWSHRENAAAAGHLVKGRGSSVPLAWERHGRRKTKEATERKTHTQTERNRDEETPRNQEGETHGESEETVIHSLSNSSAAYWARACVQAMPRADTNLCPGGADCLVGTQPRNLITE